MAFPRNDDDVARARTADRLRDRACAVELDDKVGLTDRSPSTIAFAIAAGSSERGLSVVTITRSARRPAASPIGARLPRSRSPPAPNTQTSWPARPTAGRIAVSTCDNASGVCA